MTTTSTLQTRGEAEATSSIPEMRMAPVAEAMPETKVGKVTMTPVGTEVEPHHHRFITLGLATRADMGVIV